MDGRPPLQHPYRWMSRTPDVPRRRAHTAAVAARNPRRYPYGTPGRDRPTWAAVGAYWAVADTTPA
jgi:hypothetical protein